MAPASAGRRSTSRVWPFSTRYCLPPVLTIAYMVFCSLRRSRPALAAERRRPPLRPRRRGLDSTPRRPRRPSAAAARRRRRPTRATARGAPCARPPRCARAACSPTSRPPPGHRDDVAVDLRDGVVDLVHVRLDDRDENLVARAERDRALRDVVVGALQRDLEVVERQALGALEVEELAGLVLERVQHARAVAGELRADTRGFMLDEERLDRAWRRAAISRSWRSNSIAIVSSDLIRRPRRGTSGTGGS